MWEQPKLLTVINRTIFDTPCIDCGNIAFIGIDSNLFCELCGKKGKELMEEKID